jgi:serine/threonine protein kinase
MEQAMLVTRLGIFDHSLPAFSMSNFQNMLGAATREAGHADAVEQAQEESSSGRRPGLSRFGPYAPQAATTVRLAAMLRVQGMAQKLIMPPPAEPAPKAEAAATSPGFTIHVTEPDAAHSHAGEDFSHSVDRLSAQSGHMVLTSPDGMRSPLEEFPFEQYRSPEAEASPAFPSIQEYHEEAGEGAYGVVYRATTTPEERESQVAIKAFTDPHEGYKEYEISETMRTRGLESHPNIARYMGATVEQTDVGDAVMIASEWVNGKPLSSLLQRAQDKLPLEERLLFAQHTMHYALQGLLKFEEIGIAHHDIKPDNILFDYGIKQPKIIDVGNATPYGHQQTMGMPLYCPPERSRTAYTNRPGETNPEVAKQNASVIIPTNLATSQEIGRVIRHGATTPKDKHLLSSGNDAWTLQVNTDREHAEYEAPVSNKTDPYGLGQVLHKMVEGQAFHINPALEMQDAMIMAFQLNLSAPAFLEKGAVFLPHEQTDTLKKTSGYYDFVNKAMDPNPDTRWPISTLLQHRFVDINNLPNEEKIDEILAKLA